MSKILRQLTEWYTERAITYNENDFEAMLMQRVSVIFDQFYCIPFKVTVQQIGEGEKMKPDLALIRKDLKEWFIIEVELIKDSFEHCKKQIEVFKNGSYDWRDHGKIIVKGLLSTYEVALSQSELEELAYLVNNRKPRILVIGNRHNQEWENYFQSINVSFLVLQWFEGINQEPLFRISGDYPYVYTRFTTCEPVKNTQLIVVHESSFFQNYIDDHVKILFSGQIFPFRLIREKGQIYLRNNSNNAITYRKSYLLKVDTSDQYHLLIN